MKQEGLMIVSYPINSEIRDNRYHLRIYCQTNNQAYQYNRIDQYKIV